MLIGSRLTGKGDVVKIVLVLSCSTYLDTYPPPPLLGGCTDIGYRMQPNSSCGGLWLIFK